MTTERPVQQSKALAVDMFQSTQPEPGCKLTTVLAEWHEHLCAPLVIPEVSYFISLWVDTLAEVKAGQAATVVVEHASSLAQGCVQQCRETKINRSV